MAQISGSIVEKGKNLISVTAKITTSKHFILEIPLSETFALKMIITPS